jgi:hypothetical protein
MGLSLAKLSGLSKEGFFRYGFTALPDRREEKPAEIEDTFFRN